MAKTNKNLTKLNNNVVFALLFGILIGVLGSVIIGQSFAASPNKGGGGKSGSGSLSLVMVTDNNGDGFPNWGDTVTFNVSTSYQYPAVALKCYQNSTLVFGASAGFYSSYTWPWAKNMTLSSSMWTSGSANCTAVLSGTKTLATLNFTVNP